MKIYNCSFMLGNADADAFLAWLGSWPASRLEKYGATRARLSRLLSVDGMEIPESEAVPTFSLQVEAPEITEEWRENVLIPMLGEFYARFGNDETYAIGSVSEILGLQ